MKYENEPQLQKKLLGDSVVVVNIGLSVFEEALKNQEVELIIVPWRPPRNSPSDVENLLSKLL